MGYAEYKYERFIQPQFPIYASEQFGREVLVKTHHHGAGEIMQVTQGMIKVLIGTTFLECSKGDIVFMPPNQVHEVFSLTEDAAIRGVVFEFSLIEVGDLRLDFFELFHRSQRMHYVIKPQDEGYEEMNLRIEEVHETYGNFSATGRIRIVSSLLLFMGQLIQMFSLEVSTHDKNYKKLKPVISYIEEHFAEKIQISKLSELIHVCDDRLIRLFKEVTGETPIEYIMNLRIEAAIKYLTSGDLSIAEIADRTGFGSDTYMTRVFKQKLNTTPGKYRKK